jgi:hypothetical protein
MTQAPSKSPDPSLPTIFHITHWKAGSQWVRAVLNQAAPERIVPNKHDMSHVTRDAIVRGGIYTPVYLTHQKFTECVDQSIPQKRFVVIRDLRDMLVSWYFSLKVSHGLTEGTKVGDFRQVLNSLEFEEGLAYLMDHGLSDNANIQLSWLRAGDWVIRYEDIIADEQGQYQKIFNFCGLQIPEDRRRAIVEANSFEKKTGRKKGEEKVESHHRKGIRGDWQNHFSPKTTERFKERFGKVLVETGYEKGNDW